MTLCKLKILEPGPVGSSFANTSLWVSRPEPQPDPHIIHFNMSYRPLALGGGQGLHAWIPANVACCNILLHPTVGMLLPLPSALFSIRRPSPVRHSLIPFSPTALSCQFFQLPSAHHSISLWCCTTFATTSFSRLDIAATNERLPVHQKSA